MIQKGTLGVAFALIGDLSPRRTAAPAVTLRGERITANPCRYYSCGSFKAR
jgi:hypothetical protein